MSTPREFFKYIFVEHFRYPKTFKFMSQYIVIYDQLNNNPNLKWKYRLASKYLILLVVIDLYLVVCICTNDFDKLHAALYIDMVQVNGQDKSANYCFFGVLYLYLFMYYKCFFDYPTSLMRQLKSIDNKQLNVLFSWPFSYKGRNPIVTVKPKLQKLLNIFTLYLITEGN